MSHEREEGGVSTDPVASPFTPEQLAWLDRVVEARTRGPPRRLRSQPHLCREDQAARRQHLNLVSRGMGQLVRTCQRYRLRELPACRFYGAAPCDTGGVMADTAYP